MAILATIKSGAGKIAGKVANKGGNIVAKASGLSSAQLEKIEEKRNDYLSEKPETDPGRIKRLLGSYAIEAYEAYLPQLSELYKPMSMVKRMMKEVLIIAFVILKSQNGLPIQLKTIWISSPICITFSRKKTAILLLSSIAE